jgi:hypothetical protein
VHAARVENHPVRGGVAILIRVDTALGSCPFSGFEEIGPGGLPIAEDVSHKSVFGAGEPWCVEQAGEREPMAAVERGVGFVARSLDV